MKLGQESSEVQQPFDTFRQTGNTGTSTCLPIPTYNMD